MYSVHEVVARCWPRPRWWGLNSTVPTRRGITRKKLVPIVIYVVCDVFLDIGAGAVAQQARPHRKHGQEHQPQRLNPFLTPFAAGDAALEVNSAWH